MAIDVAALNRSISAVETAAQPILVHLDEGVALRNGVLDSLAPYSYTGGHFQPTDLSAEPLPAELRSKLAADLGRAIGHFDAAAAGIRDAFTGSAWVQDTLPESNKFMGEAQRVLLSPTLGPRSADHVIDLMRGNAFAQNELSTALESGNVAKLAFDLSPYVNRADSEAFEASAHFRFD